MWWHIPAVPAVRRQKQEDQLVKAIVNYMPNSRLVWTALDLEI